MLTKPNHSNHRQQLGKSGEHIAEVYLSQKGYRLLVRNFRTRSGELDLVMQDGNTLVFIEVKARRGSAYGIPEEAVTPRKMHEIVTTAAIYVSKYGKNDMLQRIDVVALDMDESGKVLEIRHLQNVSG